MCNNIYWYKCISTELPLPPHTHLKCAVVRDGNKFSDIVYEDELFFKYGFLSFFCTWSPPPQRFEDWGFDKKQQEEPDTDNRLTCLYPVLPKSLQSSASKHKAFIKVRWYNGLKLNAFRYQKFEGSRANLIIYLLHLS